MYTSRMIETACCLPEKVISNDDLAGIVDTSDEWIRSRTGITTRHISMGENASDLAAGTARQLVEKAGINPLDIDILVVATCSGDYRVPSVACMVQKEIGAKNAMSFDISAACSGFIFALSVADKFIKSGACKNALVIGVEVLSKIIDWEDRSTCVLFGDGAAGAYLVRSDEAGILWEEMGSNGEDFEALTVGHMPAANAFNAVQPLEKFDYVKMDGRAIFKFATKKVTSSILQLLQDADIKPEEISYIVPHQANARIVEVVAKKTGIPLDKFYLNMENMGNTSAASIPIALHEMNEKKMLKRGDKIILTGFGGGLTWGTMLVEW